MPVEIMQITNRDTLGFVPQRQATVLIIVRGLKS